MFMMEMKCVAAVFSPTGTTAKVAAAVAEGTSLPVRTVDLCRQPEEETLDDGELLLAAVPVYGGRVPAVAKERLKNLHGRGPAIAVAVYGNRAYEDALLELKDTLTENGFTVVAAGAFIAEHNMVRSIAAGRPDESDLQKAGELGEKARKKLDDCKELKAVEVPGDPGYRDKKPGGGMAPHAGSKCVRCGACADACPVNAIPKDAPEKTEKNCIGCMRCVSICPQKARDLPAPVKMAVAGMLKAKCGRPLQPELFL